MIVELDLDGTLCSQVLGPDPDYSRAEPYPARILRANEMFTNDFVRIKTGRGGMTGKDWRKVTEAQLALWRIEYDELAFRVDDADLRIDDKAASPACLGPGVVE